MAGVLGPRRSIVGRDPIAESVLIPWASPGYAVVALPTAPGEPTSMPGWRSSSSGSRRFITTPRSVRKEGTLPYPLGVTRTALGTDDGGDDGAPGGRVDYGLHKYEEEKGRRAVVREAKNIVRNAVKPDKPARPAPRSLPPAERRRVDRERR